MAADLPGDSRTPIEILADIEGKLDRLLAIYEKFAPVVEAWERADGGLAGTFRAWRALRNGDTAPARGRIY